MPMGKIWPARWFHLGSKLLHTLLLHVKMNLLTFLFDLNIWTSWYFLSFQRFSVFCVTIFNNVYCSCAMFFSNYVLIVVVALIFILYLSWKHFWEQSLHIKFTKLPQAYQIKLGNFLQVISCNLILTGWYFNLIFTLWKDFKCRNSR